VPAKKKKHGKKKEGRTRHTETYNYTYKGRETIMTEGKLVWEKPERRHAEMGWHCKWEGTCQSSHAKKRRKKGLGSRVGDPATPRKENWTK